VTQTYGTGNWVRAERSGESLEIIVSQPNRTGNIRSATFTVRSGALYEVLRIAQLPAPVTIRGTRVIENNDFNGYIDVRGNATSTLIEYISKGAADRPIWNFVHQRDNIFAIRNASTGRYFTQTGSALTHEAMLPRTGSAYDDRQSWILIPQANGSYRIRSVSQSTLYVTQVATSVSLMTSGAAAQDRQEFRIGYIWNVAGHYATDGYTPNGVGFWPGDVTIQLIPVGEQPPGFHFATRMNTARSTWMNVLDVRIVETNVTASANIRVFGGNRHEVIERVRRTEPFDVDDFRYGFADVAASIRGAGTRVDTIQAGGAARGVFRMSGIGAETALEIGVFTDSGRPNTFDPFNIIFAEMAAIHELGHALGYFGHSPNPNDVMLGNIGRRPVPHVILRPAEIEHLRQAYRYRR